MSPLRARVRSRTSAGSRIALLLNPSAGEGRAGRLHPQLARKLQAAGEGFDLFVSQSEEHLRELFARCAVTHRAVVGVGGDSTLLIMAGEARRRGLEVPLGLIGLGSCNDLAAEYGTDSVAKGVAALRSPRWRRVDSGVVRANGQEVAFFLGQVSLGLGTLVNAAVAENPGHWAPKTAIAEARRAFSQGELPLTLTVEGGGRVVTGGCALAAVCNTRRYAGRFHVVPASRPDDGRLDLFALWVPSFPRLLAQVAPMASGLRKPPESWSASSFRFFAPRPFTLQVDGEIVGGSDPTPFTEIEVAVEPASWQVLTRARPRRRPGWRG